MNKSKSINMHTTYVHTKRIYQKGLSILEIVVYFSMLSVLTLVVITSLMSLFRSYSTIRKQQDLETSAVQIIDKLQRDIYRSSSIVSAQSSFGVPEGYISLTIVDGTTDTYMYYASSSQLRVSKNGSFIGNLSQPGVLVDSFMLRQINGTTSEAVKIELTLGVVSKYGTTTIYKNFYTTVQRRK